MPFPPLKATLTHATEEEKKIIAALLGKLYVSPASSEEKIRDVYADICEAVDAQILSDATGRNALYKIHVSLGKIVNNLDAAADNRPGENFRRSVSRATSLGVDDRTVVPAEERTVIAAEADIMEEDEGEDTSRGEGTVVERTVVAGNEDSLVSELLSDED